MIYEQRRDIWFRPAVDDSWIIDEVARNYAVLPVEGRTVLDLGAHIGAAALLFLRNGATHVIAVEPDPANLEVLRRNAEGSEITVIPAAVVASRLYPFPSLPFRSSVLGDLDREPIEVDQVDLGVLLDKYRPEVLKVDIEFAEYGLPELFALPPFVRALAMEIHVRFDLVFAHGRQTPDALRVLRGKVAALLASFEAQGFGVLRRADKRRDGITIHDDTGLDPELVSIDAAWAR